MTLPLSVLDLAPINEKGTASEAIASSVALAKAAEASGYHRVWYAEHHNMPTIASSATSVLIAHVGAHTSTIRLGAGGVMLPNHSPLVIAEQFGTLEAMYPGRIDLGLRRAPGSDQNTMRALRRHSGSGDEFPRDVQELVGYLEGRTLIPGVNAIPGSGSKVPVYILGSSLFGAQLAAAFGLPYAFASHFAPQMMEQAIEVYRKDFKPSKQLERPYLIVGVNVVAAENAEEAGRIVQENRRGLARGIVSHAKGLSDADIDTLLQQGAIRQLDSMFSNMAVGAATDVTEYLARFHRLTGADEIITVHQNSTLEGRLTSIRLAASSASV